MVDIVKSMADYINEQVVKIDVGKLSSPSNDAYRVGVGTKQLQEAGEQATSEGSDDGINSSGSATSRTKKSYWVAQELWGV
jgi:hypothetical protein